MSERETRIAALSHGFPPVAPVDARVLVLGSLPGRMSLEKRQYYGQPRNAFWPIMSVLAGVPAERGYADRVRALERARIALWDVLAAAERPGSLDSSIVPATIEVNDFATLFAGLREVRAVFFNGRKAADLYRRHVSATLPASVRALPIGILPSTSPAHAGMRPAEKLNRWRDALSPYLRSD